jgi:anti-anti-sigma factor
MQHVGLKRTLTADALVIRLTGDIDHATADEAAARLAQVAAALPPPGLVVLDLTRVSYLSAAGLRVVQRFAVQCAERTLRACLAVTPGTTVHRVVGILPPDPRVGVFGTVAEALRAADV